MERITGSVFGINPRYPEKMVGMGQMYVHVHASELTITDSAGYYDPKGSSTVAAEFFGAFCDCRNDESERQGRSRTRYQTGRPTFHWNSALSFSRSDSRYRELSAYYHITQARKDFDPFLWIAINRSQFAIPEYLSPVTVYVDHMAKSLTGRAGWSRRDRLLFFGKGSEKCLDALVVYHEYAHTICDLMTHSKFPSGEIRDMDDYQRLATTTKEAVADYLACALKGYPVVLECYSARNLSRPQQFRRGTCLRDPNEGSLCLSSALWAFANAVDEGETEAIGHDEVLKRVSQCLLDFAEATSTVPPFGPQEFARRFRDNEIEHFDSKYFRVIMRIFNSHWLLR